MTKLLTLAAVMAALTFQVRADLISAGEGPQGGNSDPGTETGLANDFFNDTFEFLYRFPSGEWDFDSYITVTDNGDGTADIEWDMTGSGKELWVVGVKSGSDLIHWYETTVDQRITDGAGTQTVSAPNEIDSISHISFFGKDFTPTDPPDDPPTNVPDGGATLLLLSLAFPGLALFRRGRK
jgi:hypothetical protein